MDRIIAKSGIIGIGKAHGSGATGIIGAMESEITVIRDAMADVRLTTVAGMEFEIIPTPGHTRGSVCLRVTGEDVLFTGDTLFRAGFGRMDLYGGDEHAMMRSLQKLLALPPALKVYPGHGSATTIGTERSRFRL